MMARTTYGQLQSMVNHLSDMLAERGDPDARNVILHQSGVDKYPYRVAIGSEHGGVSTSRFGAGCYSAGDLWDIIHGMLRALEGVPVAVPQTLPRTPVV